MSTLNSDETAHDHNCLNVGDAPYVLVQISSFTAEGGEVTDVNIGMRFGNGVRDLNSAHGLLVLALNSERAEGPAIGDNGDNKGNGNDHG